MALSPEHAGYNARDRLWYPGVKGGFAELAGLRQSLEEQMVGLEHEAEANGLRLQEPTFEIGCVRKA